MLPFVGLGYDKSEYNGTYTWAESETGQHLNSKFDLIKSIEWIENNRGLAPNVCSTQQQPSKYFFNTPLPGATYVQFPTVVVFRRYCGNQGALSFPHGCRVVKRRRMEREAVTGFVAAVGLNTPVTVMTIPTRTSDETKMEIQHIKASSP